MKQHVTQSELKELFTYDPETGNLHWIKSPRPQTPAGAVAGSTHVTGYIKIRINRVAYQGHRLIWLFNYGSLPGVIDHVDGDPLNNRLSNLRESSRLTNMFNAKKRKDNTSGVKGVSWDKRSGKWAARLSILGKPKHVGYFGSLEQARQAMEKFRAERHGEFTNHGIHLKDLRQELVG